MRYRSYNKEQKLAIAAMISVFNNITISRWNKDGSKKKDILVPCKYAQESQIIKSIRDKNKTQGLPVITIERTSFERDIDRVCSIHDNILTQGTLYSQAQIENPDINESLREARKYSYDFRRNMPQPMNIGFTVTFFAQYEEDLWQMQSNIIPFMAPFVIISSYHPYDKTQVIRNKIICDLSIQEDVPSEVQVNEYTVYKSNINCTFMGWFWYGNEKDKFSWDSSNIIDSFASGEDGPVGNVNEGDEPTGSQYVDEETGDIYEGVDTGKNINDGDEVEDGEWVDEETGIIYREDYHLGTTGSIKDGFYITAPAQTVSRVSKLIDLANNHSELPYHESVYASQTTVEEYKEYQESEEEDSE